MESINKNIIEETYDAIVVGAGHAGCEAALALARLLMNTLIFTLSVDTIAMMPCNPNIGGTSKGHIVREIDALGGEMGKNIDKTFIQSKMLNTSKGPAVHSLRAQADKQKYTYEMRSILENTENITIRQGEVKCILTGSQAHPYESKQAQPYEKEQSEAYENGLQIKGIETVSGARYYAKAVILATGVYLNSRCLYGDVIEKTGPNGLKNASFLTESLMKNGIEILRFKTGTPARVDKRSLDFSKMAEQKGDIPIVPFSFTTDKKKINEKEQISCFLTYTNSETHKIIKENIDRSPLFSGVIEGAGPRYCPSIEDKVMKFPDKDKHQIFVEPEGLYTNEVYLSGMSSSLPEDVQKKMIRTMAGFENAKIVRNAYAIEYDLINPLQLKPTLEFKNISGLYGAGQINGSSGYEEAAGQGLVAGINAALKIKGEEPLILGRDESYIGVLIDDLVTKELNEPYRMMTSRAEYRLLLRQDNADLRLTEIGYRVGLIDEDRKNHVVEKKNQIEKEIDRLKNTFVGANTEVNEFLKNNNSTELISGVTLAELCKRPELDYFKIREIDENRPELSDEIYEQVAIEIKYEGYIEREKKQVQMMKKLENKRIPDDIDYNNLFNLRLEARQKLNKIRPKNVGMASRISGVSPADISVLLVYLGK